MASKDNRIFQSSRNNFLALLGVVSNFPSLIKYPSPKSFKHYALPAINS